MHSGSVRLLKEIEELQRENDELKQKLHEARDIIEAIQKGSVDVVLMTNDKAESIRIAKKEDETYRRFIENMSEGVVTLHSDGIILYANSSFASSVNLPIQKLTGADFRNFISTDQLESFQRYFNEYPEDDINLELTLLDAKGTRRYFIVSLNKIQLQGTVALNLVLTDVTSQKITEQQLVDANNKLSCAIRERIKMQQTVSDLNEKLKLNISVLEEANHDLSTFSHISSHDLQEPLRKISTYSSLLVERHAASLDNDGMSCLNSIQNAAKKMKVLIQNILEYAEVSSNQKPFSPVDLKSVFAQVLDNLSGPIPDARAAIIFENELPVVLGVKSQMIQLFQGILNNALKFSKSDVPTSIRVLHRIVGEEAISDYGLRKPTGDYHCFTVSDEGIGFEPQYKKQIFNIFEKLHGSYKYAGTGIGLAICRKIVERHNGFISADSVLNQGAVFTIWLPVIDVTT